MREIEYESERERERAYTYSNVIACLIDYKRLQGGFIYRSEKRVEGYAWRTMSHIGSLCTIE